jgi:HK97 gp10 family phage protein
MAGQHSRSGIDVDAKGFLAGLAAAYADFKVESERDALGLAIVVENRGKELCAVDTGLLRSSIGHQDGRDKDGYYIDVGTNVSYGPFVEFGTSTQGAQPFMRPAVAEAVGFSSATAMRAKASRPRRKR